jgi:hypothetical protein
MPTTRNGFLGGGQSECPLIGMVAGAAGVHRQQMSMWW